MEAESRDRKRKRSVNFSLDVKDINRELRYKFHPDDDRPQTWYDKSEIESFMNDCDMISRAFQVQLTRRNKNKMKDTNSVITVPSKTVCTLGLENRIDLKRSEQKKIAIKSTLEIQEKCKNCPIAEREMRIAFVSCGATFTARCQAIADAKINIDEKMAACKGSEKAIGNIPSKNNEKSIPLTEEGKNRKMEAKDKDKTSSFSNAV